MSSTLMFSELDFEKDYDESKDSDYAPGDRVDSVYSRSVFTRFTPILSFIVLLRILSIMTRGSLFTIMSY